MFLIKNGNVLIGNKIEKLDILIENEIIKKIDKNISETICSNILNAQGKYIIPGGIDVHTHFNIDVGIVSADNFYTGTAAAAFGGTTCIVDHPGFGPKGCNLEYQINKYMKYAEDSNIDYSFHGVVQEVYEDIFSQMESLKKRGINSVKIYMTYAYKMTDDDVLKMFESAKKLDMVVCVHSEDDKGIEFLRKKFTKENKLTPIYHAESRPDFIEGGSVYKLLSYAEITGFEKLYLVHISSKESMKIIEDFRKKGVKFFVESCPQYIFLTEEKYLEKNGLDFILSPPLRKKEDTKYIKDSLINKKIDVIATDHCSFTLEDKAKGKTDFKLCPNGIPGVEERVPLLFNEVINDRLSVEIFLKTVCENPAKIFGLFPKKGILTEGSDADIVIFEKKDAKIKNVHTAAKYSCYDNFPLSAVVDTVILRGNIIIKNNELIQKSSGKFIKRI
ncbi:dihydropyrimidinase [Fusobacterium varium]|jgi:dihydropyrimidinase